MVFLAIFNAFHNFRDVAQTVHNADLQRGVVGEDLVLLDAVKSANALESEVAQRSERFIGRNAADNGFCNAARNAEYHARTGHSAERQVYRLRLEVGENYARLLYHLYQFLCGNDVINVGLAVFVLKLIARRLHLLSRAGHYRRRKQALAAVFVLLGDD